MSEFAKRYTKHEIPEVSVEVLDNTNTVLLVMPLKQVLRQKLRYRVVLVSLRNGRGEVFLHKRSVSHLESHIGLWNLAASGPVLAGESRYMAAARRLEEELGISGIELHEAARIAPTLMTDNTELTLYISSKNSAIPRMKPEEAHEGMFVDREEIRAIMRDFPHMITPHLHLAQPYLFSQGA